MNDNKIFIPPLKIQGIKSKLVPWIKRNVILSDESMWIEPFMGSGVVGFNIAPNRAIYGDINPHIIDFYNSIKYGKIDEYIVRCFLEQEGKFLEEKDDEYYYIVRDRFNKYHNPLDFLFLNRSCFNGMMRFNKNNNFNVPYGHKPMRFSKAYITKIVNQVKYVSEMIKNNDWTFVCRSFDETIDTAAENDFIYCDPPYIGRNVDYYDSWNEQQEVLLHDKLIHSESYFMLSTWDYNDFRKNEVIDTIWTDCYKINKEHYYHIGAKEKNRNPIVEALLTNYKTTGNTNQLLHIYEQLAIPF